MTNFGPPAGGSPEPWGGGRPDDAYGQAAAPRYEPPHQPPPGGWGEPAAGNGWDEPVAGNGWNAGQPAHQPAAAPGYQPAARAYPSGPQAGYPPADRYAQGHPAMAPYAEPAPPPKRGKGPLITVLAVLAVLVLGGVAAFAFLGRDDKPSAKTPTGLPSVVTDPSLEASEPAAPASGAPTPQSSSDPRFVKVGQCVRNEGPAGGKPKLLISECGAKTYQVLRRVDGATSGEKDAQTKCAKVDGYTNWYFFDSELDTLDFVLCLKQR